MWEKLLAMTAAEVDRPEVGQRARAIHRVLVPGPQYPNPGGHWWERNRRLEVAAAVISLAARQRGEVWLGRALDQVRAYAKANRFGFFRACLATSLRDVDPTLPLDGPGQTGGPTAIFRRICEWLPIPQKWLQEPAAKSSSCGPTESEIWAQKHPREAESRLREFKQELADRKRLRKAE